MSTQNYYKEKLGFDPKEAYYNDGPPEKYRRTDEKPQGYEENLTKFKDERDAVQKKTFTKWVNKHLKKARRQIRDLFEDLRDGHNLISLLEVLTGEQLPRERGQMRFHMLHNIDTALHFLRCKNVKLVNIRSEDIVDGNPKLTLGLIWTIILHFQISDIVIGQEPNVSAKDYLLRWAKRTTHKYPGVNVLDFHKSWRDGLAFSSILHRNRPDLVDWRQARQQRPRERMEHAFYVAEREYGVTRLLDPEDVDTHNPDEKSLITYISSLHEVFPEPPPIHPLFDAAAQQRVQEYREIASSLQMWIREKYSLMQDHLFPSTLIEMKKLAAESSRFRTDEVPPRQKDKGYCAQLFKDLEKYFKSVGEVDVEPELHYDNIERNWQRLMVAYQERDRRILEEIKRLEKLQMLAEKVHREIKQTDSNLDSIEHAVENESRRIKRIHPLEAKKIADQIDQDLSVTERNIQSLKTDVSTLRNGRYPQSSELDKRVNKLHERWVHLRHMLHNKIVGPLANMSFPVEERTVTKHIRTVQETRNVETNPHFRSLQEHIEWCKNKLKQLKKADFGTDLPSVQTERDLHHREHKQIDHFHATVESCTKARQYFNGEELVLYDQHLGQLQKVYAELLSFSTTRMTDLESLLDFIQQASNELHWLNDKEEIEVKRDWSDVKLDVQAVEKYFEHLMSILEDHEFQFNSVLEKGESLVLQNHPATKAIEAHMAAMNAQWAWLLQLTHCLETHLQNTRVYQQFFKDVQVAEEWLKEKDEVMNSEFSQGEFSLDIGERLLEGMQALRDELNTFGDQVQALTARSQDIVPLKQRTQPITRPMTVHAICNYKQNNFVIEKGKECTLTDNSGRTKWRVHNSKGIEAQVPGVCFVIPPPDKEALDIAERLRRQYDRSIALWQKKQLRMRQNMIFATIKVVKGWDLPQFIAIGAEQRNTIRKALNEDADKLMAEGDPSDPQLRRLRREMDEVNRLFDEFEKRARAEEESKNQTRIFNNQIMHLLRTLEEAEIVINQRVMSPLPRDIDTLQHLVLEHKEFESRLQNLEPEIEQVKDTFRSITLKTPQHKKDLEKVLDKWKYIWNTSNVYIERLKCVEIVLNGMDDASQVISEFENKLALFKELPSTKEGLEEIHDDLLRLESAVGQQQIVMDQLNDDFDNARRLTEKSRPSQRGQHVDVERLDKEVQKLNNRWGNVCAQLADRLRGCKQAYELLNRYKEAKVAEDGWLDEQYGRLENMHPIKERAKEHLDLTKSLLNSIVERTPKIEHVNISGGKFIREGKIWSKGAQRFREAMLEARPSLDASTSFQGPGDGVNGADVVADELDVFNDRFQYLLDSLYGRLKEIADRCKGDIVTLRLVEQMQPQPFKTFRTEFHMSSTNEHSSTFTTTTHYSKHYINTSKSTRAENGSVIRLYDETDSVSNGRLHPHTTLTHIIQEPPLDLRSLDEDSPGIVNPFTGAYVTVGEAIQQRILDVRTGKILASPDGRRIGIDEAREEKLIEPSVADKLQGPCGVKENGRDLTLLEAIQREIHEAEAGYVDPSQKVKVTTHSVSLNQAIDDGRVDLSSGTYTLENGEKIDIKEAYRKGYLLQHTEVKLHTGAITLSDAVTQGLIDENTGWIIDRNTGNKYQIDAAVKCNVIDSDTREVVDARTDDKVSVVQAIERGIINPKLGRYLSGHEKISFSEAKQRQRIVKPKSIKELVDESLIDETTNLILSPTHQTRLTLLEAVNRAVVDYDTIKSILDVGTDEYVTLSEGLAKGIVTADGKFKNSVTGETLSFQDAVERGYIISVVKKSIFDVDGFQPPDKSDHISFNAANAKGYISRKDNGSLLVSKSTGKLVPFVQALNSGEVKPEVYEKLVRPVGIFEDGTELTVLDAVFKGYIDPKTGNLIDLTTNKVVYLNDAIARHLITPEGASMLNSLLNLNVSTKITRTLVQRYVTVTSKSPTEEAMTYTEALRLGLVNNESQSYTDPVTREVIPIVQAISDGRLAPDTEDSEKVVKVVSTGSYSELPTEGWDLVEAIDKRLYDAVNGLFVIHGTDRQVSFEECLNLKLINPSSAVVIDPVTRRKITMTRAVEKKILDSTGHYHTVDGGKLTMDEAIKTGLVLLDEKPSEQSNQLPLTTIDLDVGGLSEAQKTRARITIEPTYKVKIGRAQSVSPEREAKRVVLQRLRKKVLRPKDAVTSGLIDEDTARLLENDDTFKTVDGDRLTLQEALEGKRIDGSSGRILDPQRGDVLSIDQAIERGLLNPDGTNELLVPLNRSLSVPELFEQGLVDVDRKVIIHPETGARLSISDAIVCDIVDPLSKLVRGNGEEITLARAIETGVLNQEDFTVESKDLSQALEMFNKPNATQLPPVGMTLPVAIKLGLVQPDARSFTHPITREIIPLDDAIGKDFIMNLPFAPEIDSVQLNDALDRKLIDATTATFKHPKSGQLYPIKEAVESGLLIVKEPIGDETFAHSTPITTVTETVDTVHTVTTRTIEISVGYALLNKNEVQNLKTGQIIPLEEAVKMGIVKDINETKNKTVVKDIKMNFSEALNKGLVDMNAGTYTDPDSGRKVTIKQALEDGTLSAVPETSNAKIKTELNIAEAFDTIYDDSSNKFKDPTDEQRHLSFKEAVESEIIDPNSMIYDVRSQKPVTVEQAIDKGLIDASTGKIVDRKSGETFDFKEATKKGLIAVLGGLALPVLAPAAAGIATAKAVKEYIDKKKKADGTSAEVIYSQKDLKPVKVQKPESTDLIVTLDHEEVDDTIVLPIAEAITLNKIEPKICRILYQNKELPYTVQDGLEQHRLNPTDHVQILTNHRVVLQPQRTFATVISKHLTPLKLSELGFYDPKSRVFVDPRTGAPITFRQMAYECGVFDPRTVLVKDLTTKPPTYVALSDALERGLIDPKSGYIVDPRTGKRVHFFEAVKIRWIINADDRPKEKFKPLTLLEAVKLDNFDRSDVTLSINDEKVPLIKAIQNNVVDGKSVTVRDPKNMQLVPYYEAVDKSIVDPQRGLVVNTANQKVMTFPDAFLQGYILSIPRPVSLQAVIHKGLYDTGSYRIRDPLTGQFLSVSQAVDRQIVDDKISEVKDTGSNTFITLEESLRNELVVEGKLKDTATGELVPLHDALSRHMIQTKPVVFSLLQTILQNYYNPRTGLILNPITGDEITLRRAIDCKLIDPVTTRIKDDRRGRIVEINEAIQNDLVDAERGVLTNPALPLDQAYFKGYILSTVLPWSLQETLAQKVYDFKTGRFTIEDTKLTLAQAIEAGIINQNVLTIKDPRSDDIITLDEAIKAKLIDPIEGQAIDPVTNTSMNLYEAYDHGLVVPYKSQITLPEAVFKGFYDPSTGKFINPKNKERLKTSSAINRGYVDVSSTLVTIDEEVVTFEQAVIEGIIDTNRGTLTSYDESLDFNEAFERGLLTEIHTPVPLSEAIAKGIYDEESQLFLDPQTDQYLTLIEAIEVNLIDAESVSVKDTRIGTWRKLSLIDAIHNNYVNGNTGSVRDYSKGENYEVTLEKAFSSGILVDNKAAISLQRAIHQGLYDESTGKIVDSNTERKVTLHEAIRNFHVNPLLPCYFDKKHARLYNLTDSCRLGVIDKLKGTFRDLEGEEVMSLSKALDAGLIVDIETANFGLYEAIEMNLYYPDEGLFVHPSNGQKFNLKDAVDAELINPLTSIVKNTKENKYVPLPIAVETKLIDDELSVYRYPHGKTIDLSEAAKKGLIVTAKRPLTLEDAVRNSLYRSETGKFVDPLNGEFYTLRQAIDNGLIDPNTTAVTGPNNSTRLILSAPEVDLEKGRVTDPKSKKTLGFDDAFKRGVLVTLTGRPVAMVQETVRPKQREYTLDEAIKLGLIDPVTAVVKDPRTGRFIDVKCGMEENQLEPSKTVVFDEAATTGPVTYDRTVTIYLKEPRSFVQAIGEGLLDVDTGKFDKSVTLRDSITLGLIDPDSVLVKDASKKKLVKLPEGFRKGLVDGDSAKVLDSSTSKLHPLSTALETGLITTPNRGFTLIEAITYSLYNPTTGRFTDPFLNTNIIDRKRYTLEEAIEGNLIDPSDVVIKDPVTGGVATLTRAVESGLVDPIEGHLMDGERRVDLLRAYEAGWILPAEKRQAVEEKYKLCDETLSKLLQWISEIESLIASQSVIHETEEDLRNQINTLKQIRDDLDQHFGQISHCGEQVKQLVLTAGDILSKSEISALEKSSRSLKTRYDKAVDLTDRLLRKVLSAREELSKLKGELNAFSTWLSKARRVLEDKEQDLSDLQRLDSSTSSTKEFVSDVIAHQADLRFITMSAQKFFDEGKEYLTVLNDFRTSLPSRLSHIEPSSSQDSPVRSEVSIVTQQYRDLLHRANMLSDRLSGVGGRQREYYDALERAKGWMQDVEPRALHLLKEPYGGDPKVIDEQLQNAKALNNEFVANGRLIDNAKQATGALLRSLEGQISPSEIHRLEQPVDDLERKYHQLSTAIANRCQELDTALVQSQGVQDALDGIIEWLGQAENQFKNMQRPASLIRERLEEQLREHKVFQSDIDTHIPSIDSLYLSANELIVSTSNARVAKKIEVKLNDVKNRFEKLYDRAQKRGVLLDETNQDLKVFNNQATKFEEWYTSVISIVDSRDMNKLPLEEYSRQMQKIAGNREDNRKMYEETVKIGKDLLNKKDVTDTAQVRERIKSMENQWKELDHLLDEKSRLSKLRSEHQNQYESLRIQVNDWLHRMEHKMSSLETVAVDADALKRQNEELKPIAKEYKDYSTTIGKINDLGVAYDGLLRGDHRPDSPSKRKGSYRAGGGRRPSQDGRSPTPTKGLGPLSPGSSGFSSRRSSQDGFHLEEMTPVQQQLAEINNRYTLLGVKITDRQSEIDSVRDEVKKYLENLRTLSAFLDRVQRHLPKDVMPNTRDEAEKLNKQIKQCLEEMYEKQSLLDSTKMQVKDLLKRKPKAIGSDALNNELEDVVAHWKSLSDHIKKRIKFMEDMKEFHDTHDSLSSWLSAKDKMLTVLGPVSSDSRMVQSQVQQVQVLREEFRTQHPQLQHLINVGDDVLTFLEPKSPEHQKVNVKLATIQQKWADIIGKLEERADLLGATADTSREFDAQLSRLRDALQGISDGLDDLPSDKDPEEQLRRVENLERQLEGQRPLLTDLEANGAHLCDVLGDPASRADIQAKLASVTRQYNALQKKLDNRKAELEGSLRDGKQFEESCAKTLGWLSDELGSLSERFLVSAIRDVLDQQVSQHEPIYRDVLAREHEVIMLLNKGRDLLGRNSKGDTRQLQRDLDKIQQQWEKLRKDIVDRHTRLQTCKEHCRKYYKVLEAFLPWLRQAEDKLDSLRPSSFQRKHIEKQLKELQAFRNEVWKKTGDYENIKSLGDTFSSACDIDRDVVNNELADLKHRWDKLGNDLILRTQALEDQSRKLVDFNENLRELQHGLERCEDKLASHDALGGASRDPKLLDRIRSLREETAKLRKPLQAIRQQAGDLCDEAAGHGIDAGHLKDDVENLSDRIDELSDKLNDRCSDLQSAATAVTQFNEQVRGLSQDLSALEAELDKMKPPGRDFKTVRSQIDDILRFIAKVIKANDDLAITVHSGEKLVDSGFASDITQTRQQVETLQKQIGKLDDRAQGRERELETTLKRLEGFYIAHSGVLDEVQAAGNELRKLKPVGSEVENIRAQQKDFKKYRANTIEPLGRNVDEVNKVGQGLIQSAASGVNTATLEKDLEKMNALWNDLKDKMNDRERKLDIGLLQSGKFQEALDGLAKWLTDTEDLVANQKPPSADYKVVKAQLQEQKFLKKMLMDRQNSMSSLFNMGNEIAKEAEPSERKAIEKQLKDLIGRFDALTEGAQRRTLDLEQAMKVAKEFQDKLVPLQDWLDKTWKKVKDMELIPTDEEKIQQKIHEHGALHDDILDKKPEFRELAEIASNLMSLVGEDEASGLADKLQDVTDRYGNLVEASEHIGELLMASRQGLRHLVLTYQDLASWMDQMEKRLARFRVLAVHNDKLLEQMDDLTNLSEEIAGRQNDVDSTVDSGVELMRHISSDEALQLKDKLDSLQRRYNDLTARATELLKNAEAMLPLVQKFHDNHNRLVEWMQGAESVLQSAETQEGEIARLELDLQELRPVLETINVYGPQLCQASPGEGASTIEGLVTRDNRRFDAIAEQIQRRAERIHLGKQRALEVTSDIDELLEWFKEVEGQLRDAERPSADPDLIRVQLKEHKALNDDISSQKGRVRDVLSTAKKVLRESSPNEDTSLIREKMEDLREAMDTVSALSSDRLGVLEQALPLAEHFHDTHNVLVNWLTDMEEQVAMLTMPALRPDAIAQQQDRNEMFLQSINEHKPLVDKLNKTGEALIRLCNEDDSGKVQELLDSDNARYSALKIELRERQQALEQALQESSKFSDKLEGMLRALSNTADQVNNLEPISAHVPKINDQIEDNDNLVDDLNKRKEAYAAVKKAADDVISKAGNRSDPAVKDIKRKLEKLKTLWDDVQKATKDRGRSLDDTLRVAEKFWKELHAVMATLKDLEDSLSCQEPPAVEPKAIQEQQVALQEIRHEIDQTKPEVDRARSSGEKLMRLCGEPDKPEVKKHIEDLDHAWDNITALYAKREENLIDAMEKAMEFHETLQNLLDFLSKAEKKFEKMGPLGADIEAVKKQIDQLKAFKSEVDPHMVKVEALNRQAQELTERTSADQAMVIKEPLTAVNRRWDDLLRGIVNRQRQLENALLRLGQFQHALNELLVWIGKTDKTLDELKPVAGDPQILEIELAKLKVLVNDIQAHQTSVDVLNDAGRQIIESGEADEASATQDKLNTLNTQWRALMQKTADRQRELEDALNDAQRFNAEIQDLISWLGEVDTIITASKPVGGLPETASEQLERFMEIYNEIEENRPKVETILAQGQEYLKRAGGAPVASNLQHNLRTLKQRWDSVTARANDKKIKLEIALKEATEFHESLQSFVNWLTNAEKILSNLKPVSRVLDTIHGQLEEHKSFQKDVSSHRETMLALDKKGTHLKYFSQKQDVILIKNLLISVQHRWERVASKSAERTRALDLGYKEAKEFHDNWAGLMSWLDDTDRSLDAFLAEPVGNDPEKIKTRLVKHQEFQKALSTKQGTYDNVTKTGKQLKDKAPKADEPVLRDMLTDLKTKWNSVCHKSVERQRKLEEALLYSGQFKDAIAALVRWLKNAERDLSSDSPVHGDLDTVNQLVDLHRQFEKELERRNDQMESVMTNGQELERSANKTDAVQIKSQLSELNELWETVTTLTKTKSERLREALKEAERLHRSVNMILDWLSEAEMKLRFVGNAPEDEATAYEQLRTLDEFRAQLRGKEVEKDQTLRLAHEILAKAHPDSIGVIKNWIKVIQSRWEEVSQWAAQRHQKLTQHVQSLRDMDESLEELIQWLLGLENTLVALKRDELPMDIPATENLIADHKEFMENTQKRQGEVDRVCKAKQIRQQTQQKDQKKFVKGKGVRGSQSDIHDSSTDIYGSLNRRQSRISPGREFSPDPLLPHIGPRFPPSGSDPEFKSPRVKFLYDKWRHVWMLSWERQRELYDHLAYLKEKEKADNFSWDDWRKRFLKFMNYKKSRLTDLFRKMDKDNNELIPREDFIEGIIKTKFDTSRLEMRHVADMFDENNRGLIDWKKFIAALRPDWEDKAPDAEAQKIHDEVKRLVMLCTCRQKFRVFQVGEGKYRFGESQKLRLVRILRSTVMVRVGGGWVALDEFLVKNDPCRAKGRTNIELREQFILADGVSQTMTAFKPKTSASSPASGSSASSLRTTPQGPITKVRERSQRSVPMGSGGHTRTTKSSLSAGTPDSLSDNESSLKTSRKASLRTPYSTGNSRSNSRPASRTGSRHGSNLSLDSTDDLTPSRIPRKTPTTSRTTSSLLGPKKVPGPPFRSSSRPHTPTGLISPASPASSGRSTGIPRASSIPTLTGISSNIRSRIPVFKGKSVDTDQDSPSTSSSCSMTFSSGSSSSSKTTTRQVTVGVAPTLRTASRTRTPSGSNTPVQPDQQTAVTKLLRKSSGASDTPTGRKRQQQLKDREPFRL